MHKVQVSDIPGRPYDIAVTVSTGEEEQTFWVSACRADAVYAALGIQMNGLPLRQAVERALINAGIPFEDAETEEE